MHLLKTENNKNLNLNLGLVKENFIIVTNDEIEKWSNRGLIIIRKYPIFNYHPVKNEKIMLGRPKTITQFGVQNLLKCTITDCSTYGGTYGMGGPGFFELTFIAKNKEKMTLSFCIWDAGSSILFDDRIITCHPLYEKEYNPHIRSGNNNGRLWERTFNDFSQLICNSTIEEIKLDKEECTIIIKDKNNILHKIWATRYSEKFPPKAGTGLRDIAFDTDKISDILLITYAESILAV